MIKYKGDGAFVVGVPKRDLSAEEWAKLPDDVKELCLTTGLYEEPKARAGKTEERDEE